MKGARSQRSGSQEAPTSGAKDPDLQNPGRVRPPSKILFEMCAVVWCWEWPEPLGL